MKRCLGPGVQGSISLVKKEPKLDKETQTSDITDDGNLRAIPKDEYKMVLGYLDPNAKKNLKLASKTCERRVMDLVPAMRRWVVFFSGHAPDDSCQLLSLTAAKKRHFEIGDLDAIEISVHFSDRFTLYHHPISEGVIQEWKENIVHLGCMVSGTEQCFVDSYLKMPRLRSLFVIAPTDEENKTQTNEESNPDNDLRRIVISTFLYNHVDTLKSLRCVNIDADIPAKLQLKIFEAISVSASVVASALKSSQLHLAELELRSIQGNVAEVEAVLQETQLKMLNRFQAINITNGCVASVLKASKSLERFLWDYAVEKPHLPSGEDFQAFNSLHINLKSFLAVNVPPHIMEKMLKSSRSSLEYLDWNISRYSYIDRDRINLDSVQLCLKEFVSEDISVFNVAAIIRSSHLSLEKLSCDSCIWEVDTVLEHFQLGHIKLPLKEFKARHLPTCVVVSLLSASQTSLEGLTLEKIRYDVSWEKSLHLQQLKRFSAKETNAGTVASVISCSDASLQELVLGNLIDKGTVRLSNSVAGLRLRSFSAFSLFPNVVTAVLISSQASLENLCLEAMSPRCEFSKKDCTVIEELHFLQLNTLKVKYIPTMLVHALINTSSATLEKLSWHYSYAWYQYKGWGYSDIIKLGQRQLKLKRFTAEYISSNIAASVIQASHSTLEHLSLEETYEKKSSRFATLMGEDGKKWIELFEINLGLNIVNSQEPNNDVDILESSNGSYIDVVTRFLKKYQSFAGYKKLFEAVNVMLKGPKVTQNLIFKKNRSTPQYEY